MASRRTILLRGGVVRKAEGRPKAALLTPASASFLGSEEAERLLGEVGLVGRRRSDGHRLLLMRVERLGDLREGYVTEVTLVPAA
jgi:hypothetical protein